MDVTASWILSSFGNFQ